MNKKLIVLCVALVIGLVCGCVEEKPRLVADFSYFPEQPYVNTSVSFTDTSTADKKIVSWLWEFGDGETSEDQSPTHRYQQPGSYTVKLTVTDEVGTKNSCEKTINVTYPPPTASFEYSPKENITVGLEIAFNDTSTPKENIESWYWDFGDNTTSTEINPKHTYNQSGTYTVKLTVTDKEGRTDIYIETIEVQ
jgi:PKD repeat protein